MESGNAGFRPKPVIGTVGFQAKKQARLNMDFRKINNVVLGVVQRDIDVEVAGETVPCVIWTPDPSLESRVLIAMGHGGSQHKKTQDIRDRAIHYAKDFGWASLAIDAPKHGDRISREEVEAECLKAQARVRGDADAPSMSPEDKIKYLDTLAAQPVPEWQVALDATLGMEILGDVEAIGYWGVFKGSWIGVPLLAAETRFKCAVLGLSQLHPDHSEFRKAAERITIPLRFAFQWDDPIRSRKYGTDLFNTFGSSDKSMHINPGGHGEIPSAEAESWDNFFQRHLDWVGGVARIGRPHLAESGSRSAKGANPHIHRCRTVRCTLVD